MIGKIIKATEFRIKTHPKATDICFSSAFITGDIAAIALPPQIAVPLEMR